MSSSINAATDPGPAPYDSPAVWAPNCRLCSDRLAKPRVNLVRGPNGRLVETPDERHYGQRMHDALEDVCDRLLRSDTIPDRGGRRRR